MPEFEFINDDGDGSGGAEIDGGKDVALPIHALLNAPTEEVLAPLLAHMSHHGHHVHVWGQNAVHSVVGHIDWLDTLLCHWASAVEETSDREPWIYTACLVTVVVLTIVWLMLFYCWFVRPIKSISMSKEKEQ